MGHRSFFLVSLVAQGLLAYGAATQSRLGWCAASLPAWLLLVAAYVGLRDTPYARILRPSLLGTPVAVLAVGWLGGWPGVAARWAVVLVAAGWHHSALQALREWTRFSVVIGPERPR